MLNFNDEIVKSRFNSINGVKMGSMCEIFSSNFCKDKALDDDGTCIEFGDEGDKLNIEIKDGKAVEAMSSELKTIDYKVLNKMIEKYGIE